MFFHSCGNSQDIRIENNILGREAYIPGKDPVSTLTNRDPFFKSISLSLFIKCHHNNGCTIIFDFPCGLTEGFFPFL